MAVARSTDPAVHRRLVTAVCSNNFDATLSALCAGADPDTRAHLTEVSKFKMMFYVGPPVTARMIYTALDVEDDRILDALIKFGADVKSPMNPGATGIAGFTPLAWAGIGQEVHRMRPLVRAGADFNCTSSMDGVPGYETFLTLAAQGSHAMEVCEFMIEECRANPNARATDGGLPLIIAGKCGNTEGAAYLIKHGAIPTLADITGYSPLHAALEDGHEEVANLLLDHGANPQARMLDGRKPLDMAKTGISSALRKRLAAPWEHGAAGPRFDNDALSSTGWMQRCNNCGLSGVPLSPCTCGLVYYCGVQCAIECGRFHFAKCALLVRHSVAEALAAAGIEYDAAIRYVAASAVSRKAGASLRPSARPAPPSDDDMPDLIWDEAPRGGNPTEGGSASAAARSETTPSNPGAPDEDDDDYGSALAPSGAAARRTGKHKGKARRRK